MFWSSVVFLYAVALGLFGIGISVAAITAQLLPSLSRTSNQVQQIRIAPKQSALTSKFVRRRSVEPPKPQSSIIHHRRSSERPKSAPAGEARKWHNAPVHSPRRRVYFVDSPARPDPPRLSDDLCDNVKPILASPSPSNSPRSSLSSFVPVTPPGIISLNDPNNDDGGCLDPSDQPPSTRTPSYFSRLPRIPLALSTRRRKDSETSNATQNSTDTKQSPKLDNTLESPISPEAPSVGLGSPQDSAPRKSSPWNYLWSSRRPLSFTPILEQSGTSKSLQLASLAKSVKPDSEYNVDAGSTNTSASTVSIVSTAYFSKKSKPLRRTSAPIPRTQPYAHPINAPYPIFDDSPPPYVKFPATDSPSVKGSAPPHDLPSKKERNAQAQAALGVNGGRRPSSQQRRAVTLGP